MERLLETVLSSLLSDYVSASKETKDGNLKAFLSSTGISLHDIEFNISHVNLPSLDVTRATASALEVKVPWSSLTTQSIEVHVSDVRIFFCSRRENVSPPTVPAARDGPPEGSKSDGQDSTKTGQNWLSTIVHSHFVRQAVNVSIFVENLMLHFDLCCPFSLSCEIESLTFVNIPDDGWVGLVKDPKGWLSKGLLIQGVKISIEEDEKLLGAILIHSMQVSCLLPIFTLFGENLNYEDERKMPLLAEISTIKFELTSDFPRAIEKIHLIAFARNEGFSIYQGDTDKDEERKHSRWEWIRGVTVGGVVWYLDIGLTLGKLSIKLGSNRERLDGIPYELEILFEHLIFHSESQGEEFECLFAIECWNIDLSCEGFSGQNTVTISKGNPRNSGDSDDHALSAIFHTSLKQPRSIEINCGDIEFTFPWESVNVINGWIQWWKSCLPLPSKGTTQRNPWGALQGISFVGHSLIVGSLFENNRLSFHVGNIDFGGNDAKQEAKFQIQIALFQYVAKTNKKTTLSNEVEILMVIRNGDVILTCDFVHFILYDLEMMACFYGCLIGKAPIELCQMDSKSAPFELFLGSEEGPSIICVKNKGTDLKTRIRLYLNIGDVQAHLIANIVLSISLGNFSLEVTTARIKMTEGEVDIPDLDFCLSGLTIEESSNTRRVFLSTVSIDVQSNGLNLEPMFQCLLSFSQVSSKPVNSTIPIKMIIETISFTSGVKNEKMCAWCCGMTLVRNLDGIQSVTIQNFGADLETLTFEHYPILVVDRKRPEVNALTMLKQQREAGVFDCDIKVAQTSLKLLPCVSELFYSLMSAKSSFENSYKNARRKIQPIRESAERISTRIELGHVEILLCSDGFSTRHVKLVALNLKIAYLQSDLTESRVWLDKNLQGESDGKLILTVDNVCVYSKDNASVGETMLIVPFSVKLVICIWPIGDKKFIHASTSPIVVNLNTKTIALIKSIVHQVGKDGTIRPKGPKNCTLENLAKDDLASMPSTFSTHGTGDEFCGESSTELIVHSFRNSSFSWIYRLPRKVNRISLQGLLYSDIPDISFTLTSINILGTKENSLAFFLGAEASSASLETGYSNSWMLEWDDPLDRFASDVLSKHIKIYSEPEEGRKISMADLECTFETSQATILLHSVGWPGRRQRQKASGPKNILIEVSSKSLKAHFCAIENIKSVVCSSDCLTLNYTDPFDCCPLTLLRDTDLEIVFTTTKIAPCNNYSKWINSIKSVTLDCEAYSKFIQEQDSHSSELLINSRRAYHSEVEFCLTIENKLSSCLLIKQIGCAEIFTLQVHETKGCFIRHDHPRLLQFSRTLQDSKTKWTDPVDVFSNSQGTEILHIEDSVIRIIFSREESLHLVVENGVTVTNSTSKGVEFQLDEEEACLAPGESIDFLELSTTIKIKLSQGWSDEIRFDFDSKMLEGSCSQGLPTLLLNKDSQSKAPAYHISYPVTLTNLLYETVKVVDNLGKVRLLQTEESADLSLSMAGGYLCQICISKNGIDSLLHTLLCPGYGHSHEPSTSALCARTCSNDKEEYMVPQPGENAQITFKNYSEKSISCILRSSLSNYQTLRLLLSPELTMQNGISKPVVFGISSKEYCVMPNKSIGIPTSETISFVSIFISGTPGEGVVATTSKIQLNMSMEGICEAVTPDGKRSFKLIVDVQRENGQTCVRLRPYIFLTNTTDYCLMDQIGNETYMPGFTGPLVTLVDAYSRTFLLTQCKIRRDGTLITVDNHTISSEQQYVRREEGSDLCYSVTRKTDRVHFIFTAETENITVHNCLTHDVTAVFLNDQGEMLRSMYILNGSQHEVVIQKVDKTLRVQVDDLEYDVHISDIKIGSVICFERFYLYRPRISRIEIKDRNTKAYISLFDLSISISGITVSYIENSRSSLLHGFCIDFQDISLCLQRGLIPGFTVCAITVEKHSVSLLQADRKTALSGTVPGLNIYFEGTVESRDRKIDYISISSSPLVAYLDDQILSKLVRLFGAGNVRHHGHVSVLDELAQEARTLAKSSLRVRRVVLKSVLIDFDVHLSKSPWLPIAIDVSRANLGISDLDFDCQSTAGEAVKILRDHFMDSLVRNAPYLFGSLQVLFDPVGMVRSVRNGLLDMVRLPLEGLQKRSISSFLSGLGYGSATLLREISSWSIGASIGFSRAMVKLIATERGYIWEDYPDQEGIDTRMAKRILRGIQDEDDQMTIHDSWWYSTVTDAKIKLLSDAHMTIRISDPVIWVHPGGIIVYAHCGRTPSFCISFAKSDYQIAGHSTFKLTSEDCRSFSDMEKSHPSDIFLTLVQEDFEVLSHILDYWSEKNSGNLISLM